MITCGKEDIKSIEVGTSTISRSIASDGKSVFNKNLQGIKKEKEKEDTSKNKGEELEDRNKDNESETYNRISREAKCENNENQRPKKPGANPKR